jgi:DNA-binding NtrC family response regulator
MEAENGQHPLSSVESQDWKMDLKEMRLLMELALILCDSLLQSEERRSVDDEARQHSRRELSPFDLANVEKMHIQRVLNYTHGNKVKAAKLLNIGITTIYRKLEEYGLE